MNAEIGIYRKGAMIRLEESIDRIKRPSTRQRQRQSRSQQESYRDAAAGSQDRGGQIVLNEKLQRAAKKSVGLGRKSGCTRFP